MTISTKSNTIIYIITQSTGRTPLYHMVNIQPRTPPLFITHLACKFISF
ncbi:uncharacterized protein METZ01_LOCUS95642 [marine metagenome]|uniref:Uncharacterized protein n=1 Tax=marine metagenome TaxID=408172 RepID=A0A381VSS6_9ZZZZ